MKNSPHRASPTSSDDKRKNSPRKYSNDFSEESPKSKDRRNKQKDADSTDIDCIISNGSIEKKPISLKKEQSDKLNATEIQLCKQSPRQNVRRKIVFNSSQDEQQSCFVDEELETVIPRRKKLRSEMTEDELWEGFPQVVRFKRLTPQKCPLAKSLNETIHRDDSNLPAEGVKRVSVDKDISEMKNREIIPIKSRPVVNIFTDFSNVVHENIVQSPDSQDENKRKTRSRSCEVNLTPKRSARLQEKRESPSVQKPMDFIYNFTKHCSSEKSRNRSFPVKAENVLTEDSQADVDKINLGLLDNEVAKRLYRSTILKDNKTNWCRKGINSIPGNTNKENDDKTNVSHESTRKDAQLSSHGNRTEKISTCLNSLADEREISSKDVANYSMDSETESTIYDLISHLISRVEIDDRKSTQTKTSSTSNLEFETREFVNKDGIPMEMSFETESLSSQNEQKTLNEDNFFDFKIPFQNQTKPSANDYTVANSTNLNSALKMRIKKHEDGAQIIYSDTIDDHAYVLSRPKDKIGKKNSKGNCSGSVRLNRKRSRQKDEGSVKRRSPRVANASSVGKGPGLVESNTPRIKDETDSAEKHEDSNKSGRNDKPKKKQGSEDEQLLKNNRIGKYACILWSSDQRRHHQQLNPDSSVQEVDDLLRKAWENLGSKDKLRYFTRASNAIRDENKHSNAKELARDTEEAEKEPCPAMKTFLSLQSNEQDDELKRWLKFFYEVSPNEYTKLKTLEKAKMKKDELKSKANKVDPLQYYRQVLYQSILDSREKITELYERKKQKQQDILKDTFGIIVKKLITGTSTEELKLSRDVVSKKLADVLLDLQYLENERKVGVSGSPLTSKSYESLVNNLKASDSKCYPCSLDAGDEDENEFSQDLLGKITENDLPLLEVESVEEALQIHNENEDSHLFSREIFEQLSVIFEQQAKGEVYKNEENLENTEINNPSSILNNWVLADQFRAMARDINRGSHGSSMYSLLDRKNWLHFLKDRNYLNNRFNCYTNVQRNNFSNNNSAPKTEYYQDKIDRLNNLRQPQQTCQSPTIQMIEPLGLQKIRPTLSVVSPQSLIPRPSPVGHTFVKFSSQPLGRCRVFSVRQTK